jgi:Asp-tRNA(Asn)/Glu-tRNA(Gln) amidotransferase A subunit family amidase
MKNLDETRRRFMAHFAGIGLGSTLLPGVLWGQLQQSGSQRVTAEMLKTSLAVSGIDFSEEDRKAMLQGVNQSLTRYEELHKLHIPNNTSLPLYFTTIVPGMEVNKTKQPFRISDPPSVKRPANLEDVAFWPVRSLAELVRTKQVTSVELTEMYLARLHRINSKLNCVVTFLDDLGMQQAKQADSEIAAGKYKGPLHGIPWGAKDIITVKGYKTTWGSDAYKDQMLDEEASVVEMLRNAGAVLIAKLCTGEFAHGDQHLLGQTKNPWNLNEGSSGSSCGPGSATGGGGVGFSIGTETSGSILGPSGRCGVTGLRPTFGRISRYGVMVVSWTQDRLGPMCRYSEDCALVMQAIAKTDGRDLSVSDIPFNWNAQLDIKKLRVGYIKEGFDNATGPAKENHQKLLEQIQKLGVKLVPMEIPEFPYFVSSYEIEEGVFQNELVLSGRYTKVTRPQLATGFQAARAVGAVDYLVSQRARMMMMTKLAEATAPFDVWLAVANTGGGAPGAGGGARGGGGGFNPGQPQSVTQRHSGMANSAGYPALAIHDGWVESGSPTSVTFFGRPFGEANILALGKAYQDAAQIHTKHPKLDT